MPQRSNSVTRKNEAGWAEPKIAGLSSFVPLDLPFPPVLVFAISVVVQCSQHADARHHGRAIELDDQEQGFDRGLPLIEILLGLGKLLDIVRGILKDDELAA